MLHEPAQQTREDHASPYKTRVGVLMFLAYALIYVGFIAINVIDPPLMETIVFAGLNLAIVYGFGLIVLAIILAIIFNALCVTKELELNADGKDA
jgi:uncharacterized membrane protein (DUF485 family)